MKKLLLCIFVITLLFITGCNKEEKTMEKKVMELDSYKDLVLDDIVSIETVKYTVGGDNRETTSSKDDINRIYNMVNSTMITDISEGACEDNTTVYILKTKDKSYKFEFECNWFIYEGKHYNVK